MTDLSRSGVARRNSAISAGEVPRRPIFCMSAMPFFAFLLKRATASWYSSLDAFFFSMPDTSLTTAGGATDSPSSAARAAASAASANLAAFFASAAAPVPSWSSTHPPSAASIPLRHSSASALSTASRAASAPVRSVTPGSPCATRTREFTSRSKRLLASRWQSKLTKRSTSSCASAHSLCRHIRRMAR